MSFLLADSASELEKVYAVDANLQDEFGHSVAFEGDMMIVGVPKQDSGGTDIGAAYIYQLSGSTWVYQTKIIPSDGQNYDSFGHSVSISGNMVIIGATGHDSNGVSNAGAAYVFANTSGNIWVEQDKLSVTDSQTGDIFGQSVAISGNLAIVGASWHNISGVSNSGTAYIFANTSDNIWVQQDKVYPTVQNTNAYFGHSVSMSDNVAVVGAYKDSLVASSAGTVFVYANTSANIWTEQIVLNASDYASSDEFGTSVSLDGNVLLIGSPGDDVEGAAYIYTNTSGNIWTEQQKLEPAQGLQGDDFGTSVALSGNQALIGAVGNDEIGTDTGSVHLFVNPMGNAWVEEQKFVAGDGVNNDEFGTSVGVSGNFVVVGATFQSSQGESAGAIYSFDLENLSHAPVITPWPLLDVIFPSGQSSVNITSSNLMVSDFDSDVLTWSVFESPSHGNITTLNTSANQIDSLIYTSDHAGGAGDYFVLEVNDGLYSRFVNVSVGSVHSEFDALLPFDSQSNAEFGRFVDTDGFYMIVGAPKEDSIATDSGAAYIYARSGNSWVYQTKLKASDAEASDNFGYDVSVSGNQVIVGAYQEDTGASAAGAAYIFANTSDNVWVEQTKLVSDHPGANYNFGKAVSISGNMVLIGSENDAYFGSSRGSVFVFSNTSDNVWSLQTRLFGSDTANYDRIGNDVELSGNLAIIGASLENFGDGTAYILEYTGGNTWIEQALLRPSDRATSDRFGTTVSISGNLAMVGSTLEDSAGTDAGTVYVYATDNGLVWEQQAKLRASDAENLDNFGESISLSGTAALIGTGIKNDYRGAAYLFVHQSGNVWVEQKRLINPISQTSDYFGRAVALSGNLAVIGAPYNDNGASNAGEVYTTELGAVAPYIAPNLSYTYEIDANNSLVLDVTDISAISYYDNPLQWTLSANGMQGEVISLSTVGDNIINLTYVPNVDFSGLDSFVLRVTDSVAGSYFEQLIQIEIFPGPFELPGFNSIAAGHRLALIHTSTNLLLSGVNDFGQIGLGFTGSNVQSLMPNAIGASTNQIAAGAEHVVVLDDSGIVWTWGNNNYGQLGHGDLMTRSSANQVMGLSNVLRVYAGAYSSYAITESGDLYSWGRNHDGQLGLDVGGDFDTPQLVSLPGEIQDLSVGVAHVLAVIDGDLYAWGSDGFNQLGDGVQINEYSLRDAPLLINNVEDWKRVNAGGFHSHAWTSTNTIYAWGKNLSGQLGVGHHNVVSSANTDVVSLANIQSISSGYTHSLFLQDDGGLWAAGSNVLGQISSGEGSVNIPQPVSGVSQSDGIEISAGPYSSMMLETSPLEIYIWGRLPSGNVSSPMLFYTEP